MRPHGQHPTDSIWLWTGRPRAAGHRASALAWSCSSGGRARGRSPRGRRRARATLPGDRALFRVGRLLCQRFFFSGRAVEREVVWNVGYLGVPVALGRKTKVEHGVEGYTLPQPSQVPGTTYRTDRRQNALSGAGYLLEEDRLIAASRDALPRAHDEQSDFAQVLRGRGT